MYSCCVHCLCGTDANVFSTIFMSLVSNLWEQWLGSSLTTVPPSTEEFYKIIWLVVVKSTLFKSLCCFLGTIPKFVRNLRSQPNKVQCWNIIGKLATKCHFYPCLFLHTASHYLFVAVLLLPCTLQTTVVLLVCSKLHVLKPAGFFWFFCRNGKFNKDYDRKDTLKVL